MITEKGEKSNFLKANCIFENLFKYVQWGVKEKDSLPAVVFMAEMLKKTEMQNMAENEIKYNVENVSGKRFKFSY